MTPPPVTLLNGLRVVEIGQYIAAPYAATLLADCGAEVVKIERPGGDPLRQHPERYAAWNRGKRTITLDLHDAAGRAGATALLDDADIVIENLRPGALDRLDLDFAELRRRRPAVVTCSISAWGSDGPSRDEAGWEPLVHARAGAQQGLFTGDQPQWLPFPVASVGAALLGVLGIGAALVKREATGYGQHVETSLFDALLFLNGGAILHREGRHSPVIRTTRSSVLHTYDTADGRHVQVNMSGVARWRELCRLLGMSEEISSTASLTRLAADREWSDVVFKAFSEAFAGRTADEWEEALLASPAAAAKCNTLEEWVAHPQAAANTIFDDAGMVATPIRVTTGDQPVGPLHRHGLEGGALAGLRVIDLSSFWAGPLAARLLAELGADVVKVEPPGGEGAFKLLPGLPNIYLDGNRSKRGVTLDLRDDPDRRRLLDLVSAADVVVENAVPGAWERAGLDEAALRAINPSLVYARAKGFGLTGPLASRPTFDYVVQGATGMEMIQGGDRARPTNFTVNDYGTGLHLAAATVLALLARARGVAVSTVEASLMMTATVYEAEHVAALRAGAAPPDAVGPDRLGPSRWCRLYQAADGWLVVCAATAAQRDAMEQVMGNALEATIRGMPRAGALERLAAAGIPAAPSVHASAVPDDPQVRERNLLTTTDHRVVGRMVQVGVPLRMSVDTPAVKGPAPAPARKPARR